MNTFNQRIADAAEDARPLVDRLREAAEAQGWDDERAFEAAIQWTATQLDPDEDDYETWEATVLARLENPDSGER